MKAMNAQAAVGQKYGRLTVLRIIGIRQAQHKDRVRNKYFVECKCDCGSITEVNVASLLSGSTVSCGCYRKEQSLKGHDKQRGKARPHVQKPNGYSILHSWLLTYQNAAKRRSLSFDLTEAQFEQITAQNCHYCGAEPVEKHKPREHASRKLNGIDRIDSDKGYSLENCVPCCKRCNYLKHIMTYDEMIEHISKILAIHNKRLIRN